MLRRTESLLFRLVPAFVFALCAAPALADTLVTKDGRVIEVQKAREEGENYRLVLKAGEIVVPKSKVASVEIEGDMSDYVPKDDKEKEFLAKGYVRHKGKWISRPQYEVELAKVAAERKKRTDELARRSDFDQGWEVESKHFKWRSNTSPEILQRYIDLLEAYYDLMDQRIGIKPTLSLARTKMRVNVFKRQSEMIEKANDEDIDENVLGYFSSSEQTLNFFHDYKDPEVSEQTALHECTHLLTYLIDPDYWAQIWINEGVAEYFGTCTITEKKGQVVLAPGRAQEDSILTVQEMIKEQKAIPLAKLLTTAREEFDGLHYAHAWSFVHFVQSSPKYAKNFNKFFKELYGLDLKGYEAELLNTGSSTQSGLLRRYKPEDVRDAMLKALAVKDIAALEKEWMAFVRALPIEGARARFLRGYRYAMWSGKPKEALKDLDDAIAGGYAAGEAYWARGYAKFFLGDREAALADFKKAVELEPLDGVYRADVGWCLTGFWGEDTEQIHGSPEEQDEAGRAFALAAELDPENDQLVELAAQYVVKRAAK